MSRGRTWIRAKSLIPAGGLAMAAVLIPTGHCTLADEAKPLPSAETILDRYVEVTGGEAAYEKLTNRVARGKIEFAAMGVSGTMVMYQMPPAKTYVSAEFAGMGKSEEGFDGEVAWEKSDMMGARLKEGDEKRQALEKATFNSELHWRKLYSKAECTGTEDVEGRACHRVVLTPAAGGSQKTQFYDRETGLLVKENQMAATPMGEIPVESLPSDYREVDGIRIPFKISNKFMDQPLVITMEKIEHNVEMPADRFALPKEIQALVERKAEKKEGASKASEEKIQ